MAGWWGRIRTGFSWAFSPLSPVTWLELAVSLLPEDEQRSWRHASPRWRKAWWVVLLLSVASAALLRVTGFPTWAMIPFVLVSLGGAIVFVILALILLLRRESPAHVSVLGVLWSTYAIGYWLTAVAMRLTLGRPD